MRIFRVLSLRSLLISAKTDFRKISERLALLHPYKEKMLLLNLNLTTLHARASGMSKLPLKILLQERKTGLYFQDFGKWTPNREEATDFQQSAKASGFILQTKLPNMDIILGLSDPNRDIRIPCSLPPQS
ncbi:MAG: hypothetical protein JWQ71_5059 [Pedosphaera sp.]|nr:hypothetical protein [Pedosphaera sp.]